jgi:glucose-6-phosphate isomerase
MYILLPLWPAMESVSVSTVSCKQSSELRRLAMIASGDFMSPKIQIDWLTGIMHGAAVQQATKTLGDLAGIFHDTSSLRRMDESTVVYRVQWMEPVVQGTEGGLFGGSTIIEPGRVGDEYFMTHGHFHAKRDRGEYYGAISGKGLLVIMDEDRITRTEEIYPGSLHYIAGGLAHRVVNTGEDSLLFWACWPSDAGHDYASIKTKGFGARVLLRDGGPAVVPA